jgi:hypothetical protein
MGILFGLYFVVVAGAHSQVQVRRGAEVDRRPDLRTFTVSDIVL